MQDEKPGFIRKQLQYEGRLYEYEGKTRKNSRSSLSCPFCEKEMVLALASKDGQITSFSSYEPYFLIKGSSLFSKIIDELNSLLIEESLEEIKASSSCSHCKPRFADDCNSMTDFVFPE